MNDLGLLFICFGAAIPFSVLLINPLLIWVASRHKEQVVPRLPEKLPSIAVVIAVHNGAVLIGAKLENTLAIDYPKELLTILVVSDGSSDATAGIVNSFASDGVQLFCQVEHRGKVAALNLALGHCHTELVLFSDADAKLSVDSLLRMVPHFSDPRVGGVCGQRVIASDDKHLGTAQADYIGFDSWIKARESRLGALTSNDGKIYLIRRDLFTPILPAVTDDLYVCLDVIRQGYRFLFEPSAKAFVPPPSRSLEHELERRRRIVSQSLNGLFYQRQLFNVYRYGTFSLRLLVNKVVRRLLPFGLLSLLLGSLLFAAESVAAGVFFALQLLCYLVAGSFPYWQGGSGRIFKLLDKFASRACYFALGNLGTLLGCIDFLRGRQPEKWTPKKTAC